MSPTKRKIPKKRKLRGNPNVERFSSVKSEADVGTSFEDEVGIEVAVEAEIGVGVEVETGVGVGAEVEAKVEDETGADDEAGIKPDVGNETCQTPLQPLQTKVAQNLSQPQKPSKLLKPQSTEKPLRLKHVVLKMVVLAIVSLILILLVLFFYQRWWRYDDVADIQGTWRAIDADYTLEITADQVIITKDAVYSYKIDTGAKTLQFSFLDSTGSNSYRFSADRNSIAIMDGNNPSAFDTFRNDFIWLVQELYTQITNNTDISPAGNEKAIVLVRVT